MFRHRSHRGWWFGVASLVNGAVFEEFWINRVDDFPMLFIGWEGSRHRRGPTLSQTAECPASDTSRNDRMSSVCYPPQDSVFAGL